MPAPQVSLILEDVLEERLPLVPMNGRAFDQLMARGWRVLGYCLLRHNYTSWDGLLVGTIPLRILVEGFAPSKSQRRVLRRHDDLRVVNGPIEITPEKEALFERHCTRFRSGAHMPLSAYLTPESARMPVPGLEFRVYDRERLLACSFVHIGHESISATYCFYEPDEPRRSLGLYTMLLEIAWAQRMGKRFYYHGYCHSKPSQFDYKLNFQQLQRYDWSENTWQFSNVD